MAGFGWQELLIILLIVLVIFGGSRVAGLGSSLGKAISGFRRAVKEPEEEDEPEKTKAEEEE